MTKRRFLKTDIKMTCNDLFNECVAMSLYHNVNIDNTTALLHSIVKTQKDYVSRVSHVEPGMKSQMYFKDLINNFKSQVSEIVDQINNLH